MEKFRKAVKLCKTIAFPFPEREFVSSRVVAPRVVFSESCAV